MLPAFSDQQWERFSELFAQAAGLPAEDQPRFLASIPEPELRDYLRSLLPHGQGASHRIAHLIETAAQSKLPAADWTGRLFGPYRILREIGRGGMGIVFEAERADREYLKRVALKISSSRLDTAFSLERFRYERQILAQLEHSNIARFLDGGSEDGLPYFAMEFVEGIPVTAYCLQHQLPLRARIALFRQICAAVDYAHEHLIVHRDLKPSNILVTQEGIPKLLDFGIAKLLSLEPQDTGAVTGAMLWTPDYASPEQVRGRPVTRRTDVYSLGLILYEMLSGARAQIADSSSPLALDQSICETEPPPPSHQVTSGPIAASTLRGDLDTIVAMATRKEPERRYESAAALSEDLRRYLDAEPVLARPGSSLYRAWKFLRRHRAAAAAALIAIFSLLAGTGVSIVQARRAERRFDQVRKLANTFLFDFHDRIQNLPGATSARAFVLTTSLGYLDSLAAEAGNDTGLLMELAVAYQKVATVQGDGPNANLGQTQEAAANFTKAIDLAGRVLRNHSTHRLALRTLTESHTRKGDLLIQSEGRKPEGMDSLRAAQDYSARLLALPQPEVDDLVANTQLLIRYGDNTVQVDPAAAIPFYQKALLSAQAAVARSSTKLNVAIPSVYLRISRAYRNLGDSVQCAATLDQAIAAAGDMLRTNPSNAFLQQLLTAILIDSGSILGARSVFHLNNPAKALIQLHRAEKILEQMTAADTRDTQASQTQLINWDRLADVYLTANPAKSIAYAQRALASLDRLLQSNPRNFRLLRIRWSLSGTLASALTATGAPEKAIPLLQTTLAGTAEMSAKSPGELGISEAQLLSHLRLGAAFRQLRRFPQSESHIQQALRLTDDLLKENPKDLYFLRDKAWTQEALADLHTTRANLPAARQSYLAAQTSWQNWSQLAPPNPFPQSHLAQLRAKLAKFPNP